MKNDDFYNELRKELLNGSLAGLAISIVGHPFDTLKI